MSMIRLHHRRINLKGYKKKTENGCESYIFVLFHERESINNEFEPKKKKLKFICSLESIIECLFYFFYLFNSTTSSKLCTWQHLQVWRVNGGLFIPVVFFPFPEMEDWLYWQHLLFGIWSSWGVHFD